MVEKWIRWIPPINGRFKLNFDGSRDQNISASRLAFRYSNGTIKMAASRHLGNASIIIEKCLSFRDCVLTTKNNGFLDLEIQ